MSETIETRAVAGDEEGVGAPGIFDRVAVPSLLFLMALGIRLLTWPSVFRPDGVHPYGNDAFYHLRRIRYSVENFPSVLSFDPFINYPHGAQPIWPPTFDWLIALLIRMGVGPGRPETLERWVMCLPPVFGALTVVAVYFLGRRFFTPRTGLIAALLLALTPAHYWYSQLGFADHHFVVSLLSVAILWTGMRTFGESPRPHPESALDLRIESAAGDRGGLWSASMLGFALAMTVLVWPGSLIHVGIVQVAMVACILGSRQRQSAVFWSRRFALTHAVLFVTVLPMSVGNESERWGDFSPLVLSNFQPLYFGSAATLFGLCAVLWSRSARFDRAVVRGAAAGVLGLVTASALFALVPELRVGAMDSWAWLSLEEDFQPLVVESAPLFYRPSGLDLVFPSEFLTPFIFVVPLAIGFLGWRDRQRGDRIFYYWWAGAFFIATLSQRRFVDTYSVPHMILLAQSIVWIDAVCRTRLRGSATGQFGSRFVVGILLALFIGSTLPVYEVAAKNVFRVLQGEPLLVEADSRRQTLQMNAARWLGTHSPPLGADGYSVLAPWADGHVLKYLAERPIVQDNFGDDVAIENFRLADSYFASLDESEALAILEKTRTRYVIVRQAGSGQSKDYEPASMFSRLYAMKGSRGEVNQIRLERHAQVAALDRHRLIYESAAVRPSTVQTGSGPSYLKIFEVVQGARLVGRTAPNEVVKVRLKLQGQSGPFRYDALTNSDSNGRYALRLPYPNETFSPAVRAASAYTLVVGAESRTFRISEEAVQRGLDVEGPSF